jgi:hypothetical protein
VPNDVSPQVGRRASTVVQNQIVDGRTPRPSSHRARLPEPQPNLSFARHVESLLGYGAQYITGHALDSGSGGLEGFGSNDCRRAAMRFVESLEEDQGLSWSV